MEGELIPLMEEENLLFARTFSCHAERRKSGRLRPRFRSRSTPTLVTLLHPRIPVLLKSSHCGFIDLIKTIFFSRRQPFSCFSRPIAL